MKTNFGILLAALIFLGAILSTPASAHERSDRPNVLFFVIDDLRAELACYGDTHIHSPHIDAFAASGLVFEHAYCQQSVCNPSRTSVMTGMRPDSTGVVGNHSHFRSAHPDVVTLPQHFKNHGYHAAAIGKIYHGVFPEGASSTPWDTMGDPESWSVPATRFGPRYYYTEAGIAAAKRVYEQIYKPTDPGPDDWTKKLVFGPATESPDVPDNTLYDGQVADAAVKTLQQLKGSDRPFFLAVGFIKPHSPYVAPKKYFDHYEHISLPASPDFPVDAPRFAGHGSGELRRYTDQPKKGVIPNQNQRRVRQAYYACISYIDAQIGRVLNEVDRLRLAENTIVVLFSDHGYHLGEQGLWGKTTNFELDTRVPLIVRAPGKTVAGQSSTSLVELVDLYPTLVELAGLPIPGQLEGKSFAPVLGNPGHVTKKAALSQYPRGGGLMGYSMRTATHRLTHWVHRPSGTIRATELYNYADGQVEQRNVAGTAPSLVAELSPQLAAAFAWDRPKSAASEPSLQLPRVFGNHMVLQADAEIMARREESANRDAADDRPNILLIVGEDHGCELSCYGDPVITTPHLDRLASQGVLFESGYVTQSVCSPSRSTIFTGLYPHQNGQLGLATHQYGWFKKWPTTYSLLKQAGYRTGLIGKTHVIPADAVESFVDFRFQPSSNFAKKKVADYAVKAGEFFRDGDEPFFMTVNYPDAHWPLQGQVEGLPKTQVEPAEVQVMPYIGHETPRMREVVRNYYDCMLRLDACVGQLLEQLESSGKANNTLVVFIGDHGAQMARGKVTVYEGGMRIPYIVRWPGVTKPNSRSEVLVSTIDLLPTFADAAKIPPLVGLPGKSLRPVLQDSSGETFRDYLVCERNCDAARHTFPQRTVRDARYKLIHSPVRDREDPAARYYRVHGASHWSGCLTDEELAGAPAEIKAGYARWLNPPEFQLYDLQNDPHEWFDLSSDPKHTETKQRLQQALKQWQADTRDPLADPDKLQMLMEENDAVFKAGRRWPEDGWQYLKYLAPQSKKALIRREAVPVEPTSRSEVRPLRQITGLTKRNFDWGAVDQPESDWPDTQVASWAAEFLSQEHAKPFFLAVGIFRPHVPWFNPRGYEEQYSLDSIILPIVKSDDLDDLGPWAKKRALDRASRHAELVEYGEWKPAVQAYLASISFADANIGRVLTALEASKYRENTIVVLWSDHGYHLGEKGHWHKRTLWERSTHVPLVVVAPGVTGAGTKCTRPVSLLDVYPTLISLCGLAGRSELEGHDLTPLLKTPQAAWPHAAVSTWNVGNHAVRTEQWRYIRYSTGEEELYDHDSDPHEWHNLAADAAIKQELACYLPTATNTGSRHE